MNAIAIVLKFWKKKLFQESSEPTDDTFDKIYF